MKEEYEQPDSKTLRYTRYFLIKSKITQLVIAVTVAALNYAIAVESWKVVQPYLGVFLAALVTWQSFITEHKESVGTDTADKT